MTSIKAWSIYRAITLHFKSEAYDYFKYNGKVKNISKEGFDKLGNLKFMFEKLSSNYPKEDQLVGFYVANILDNRQHISGFTEESYLNWLKRIESLPYIFEEDLNTIGDGKKSLTIIEGGDYPILLTYVMQSDICLETFIILQKLINFFPLFDKEINDDIIWPMWKKLCDKYYPFLSIDLDKYKHIAKEVFNGRTK